MTRSSISETRNIATMVVRVEDVGVWGEEGRRRDSLVKWRQMLSRQEARGSRPTELSLRAGGREGGRELTEYMVN